ncbi:MAG: ASCH domain-containing protein [Phycisphaerales bacterium]|nr:ASCH domain-containing protein [Phycisphaerales bacterium]
MTNKIEINLSQVAEFIARFKEINPLDDSDIESKLVDTDYFGDSPEMADNLLGLVIAGTKTATCSSLWEWEHERETPLEPGYLAAIIDGCGNARCIIQTLEVKVTPYNQVTAEFAKAEGEGDLTLEWWRKAHWDFFSRTLPRINKLPTQDMPLLCERFRVIYREDI